MHRWCKTDNRNPESLLLILLYFRSILALLCNLNLCWHLLLHLLAFVLCVCISLHFAFAFACNSKDNCILQYVHIQKYLPQDIPKPKSEIAQAVTTGLLDRHHAHCSGAGQGGRGRPATSRPEGRLPQELITQIEDLTTQVRCKE